MTRRSINRFLTWLLITFFVAGIFMPMAPAAQAEGNPSEIPGVNCFIPDSTIAYQGTPPYFNQFNLWYAGASVKDITKLKSSNKSVATVKKLERPEWPDSVTIQITPKKIGKTVISFAFKHDNKTYQFKINVTVKKYVNPFKSLKIGSFSFEEYLDSADHTEAINAHVPLKKTLSNKKLSFKLKTGWKLQELFMLRNGKLKTLKNGKKITVKKGDEIDFLIKDPKGDNIWFYFFFD